MNIIRYNETLKIINFTVQLVIIYLEKKKEKRKHRFKRQDISNAMSMHRLTMFILFSYY